MIRLRFLGAARNVTGSRYLIEMRGRRYLVDCGLFQERDYRSRNWEPFDVEPSSIDAVLLTHAHLDHTGYLPKLARDGFRGKVLGTPATLDITEIVLLDSAHIQEEDAEHKRKRHEREGRTGPHPEVPLYTREDAQTCLSLFTPVGYGSPVRVGEGVEAEFFEAGHILGSSMIRLRLTDEDGSVKTVLFSGDIGRWDVPILRDPTLFREADYVLVESTYGNRLHEDAIDGRSLLADVINSAKRAGGNVVIPSFAIGRTQELLYHLNALLIEDRIPHLLVFVDSPMAARVTDVFRNHRELYDREMEALTGHGDSPFELSNVKATRSTRESKAINHLRGTVVIIAGSGMCTGGRIKHHLVHNISDRRSTLLFVGYQAVGTLGREIVDGRRRVRLFGQQYAVKARVTQIHGFSAHADRNELMRWLEPLLQGTRGIFVTHGEPAAAQALAERVRAGSGARVVVPGYRDEAELD